jgi:hypothetical protein
MLRHVSAPVRDFTQIPNAPIWDDDLSDAAFRLLVRSVAMPGNQARGTTVTQVAAGLGCGRITADRARRQLQRGGLLHVTKWRSTTGQVRSESLISNVPLSEAEAEQLFAAHFTRADDRRIGGPTPPASPPPDAGPRRPRPPVTPCPGIALPTGGTQAGNTPPSLPAPTSAASSEPAPDPAPDPSDAVRTAAAEQALLSLRRHNPHLHLGAKDVKALAPLATEWLLRGVPTESLCSALASGLPAKLYSPRALLRRRLLDKMPPAPTFAEQARLAAPPKIPAPARRLTDCRGCERPFRPLSDEIRCRTCRQEHEARMGSGRQVSGRAEVHRPE